MFSLSAVCVRVVLSTLRRQQKSAGDTKERWSRDELCTYSAMGVVLKNAVSTAQTDTFILLAVSTNYFEHSLFPGNQLEPSGTWDTAASFSKSL